MKQARLFMLLSFLTPLVFSSPVYSQTASGPKMFLPERQHDFKEVGEGAVVEHTFKVENRGDQILEIQRVNPG